MTESSVPVKPADTRVHFAAANSSGTTTAKVVVTVKQSPPELQVGAAWLPYSANSGRQRGTRGTNPAVDKHGGVHVAYAIRASLNSGPHLAYYAYCKSNCTADEQGAASA